jgi:dipeptidyl aminopeptidase/acylaminoacyl peptidase
MKTIRLAQSVSAVVLALASAGYAVAMPVLEGPPARPLTDPRSVSAPVDPRAGPIPLESLFKTHAGLGAAWAADGGAIILATDLGGRINLWRQSLKGGAPVQITRSEDRQWAPTATRDGRWIVFQSDIEGREIYGLYAVSPNGGPVRALTADPDASDVSPVVSFDSKLVGFNRRLKSEPSNNVAVVDLATGAVRVLTHETDPAMNWSIVAFSHDGARIIANRADVLQTKSAVYSIDVKTGAARLISAEGPKVYVSATDLSPDGLLIAATVETPKGERQAAVLNAPSGAVTFLKPDAWEQSAGKFSPDGRVLLMSSNVDGRDFIYAYDVATAQTKDLDLPAGVNSDYSHDLPAYSPSGEALLFPHQSGSEPLDYWAAAPGGGNLRQITHLAQTPTTPVPKTTIVHYASADGTVVSALLWTPYNLARTGAAPAVLLPHGGPTGQTRDSFDRTATALASRGYLVLAPNPRGSTGYGRAFQLANTMDLGGGDLEDEVAGAKFLVATGYADPKRIGITGGSYGGYMTLMALAKTPDVWAAGVEEYGIVNWRSMYERGSPGLKLYQTGLLGTPEHDPESYDRASPLTYLEHIKAPLLVLQGENDIRVPKGEAEQVVAFLHKKNATVDAHYYPAEGHGFSKPENQIDALRRAINWFDCYLKGACGDGR